jgi:formate hydrogenlyase subunit 4
MTTALNIVVHLLLVLLLPPLLPGLIARTKAQFAGRAGPPLLQPYYDLLKLWQKETVFSTTTTWVFRAGPVVGVATALVAALLVPCGAPAPFAFAGDLILLVYLFGLGRFFITSAALDTGSAFEGMGAAREVTFACLSEPALLFGLVVLASLSQSASLGDMFTGAAAVWGYPRTSSLVLVLVSWFLVLLVENCRVPFDDPNTHLELTMIHEVMVLDHSGPAFGMILYGASLKLYLYAALVCRLALPWRTGLFSLDWALFTGEVLGVAVLVGVVESVMARLRLVHVPVLLTAACLLSGFGFVLLLR